MKITSMTVKGYRGIKEERTYDLTSSLAALWGTNGQGKTSAIEAFRFALTGESVKNAVNAECDSATVTLKIGTDTLSRTLFSADGRTSSTVKLNGTKITAADGAQYLTNLSDVPMENIRAITSSELISAMSRQLGDFFLTYIKDTCTKKDLVQWVLEDNKENKNIFTESLFAELQELSEDEILWKDVVKQHKICIERKKILKRQGKEKEVLYRNTDRTGADLNIDVIKAKLEALNIKIGANAASVSQLNTWNNAEFKRKQILDKIAALEKEVAAIQVENDNVTIKELKGQLLKINLDVTEQQIAQAKLSSDKEWLSATLAELEKENCPLGKGLTQIACISNFTEAKIVAASRLQQTEKEVNAIGQRITKRKAQATAIEERIEKVHAQSMDIQKKKMLLVQIEDLKETLPDEVERPDAAVIDYSEEKKTLNQQFTLAEDFQKSESLKQEIKGLASQVYALDVLCASFTGKGCVCRHIMDLYIQSLTDAVNTLEKDTSLDIKFVYEDGLKCLFKTGTLDWRDYNLLSTGEQMMALFLIANLCNHLSGLNIMIMDNLDSLDDKNLDDFLKILAKNAENYDNIIIAGVNHKGTKEILKKYNIQFL